MHQQSGFVINLMDVVDLTKSKVQLLTKEQKQQGNIKIYLYKLIYSFQLTFTLYFLSIIYIINCQNKLFILNKSMSKNQILSKKPVTRNPLAKKKRNMQQQKNIHQMPSDKLYTLENDTRNLNQFLKNITSSEKSHIKSKKQIIDQRQEVYTSAVQNIYTKQQTFATLQESKPDLESKSIWADESAQKILKQKRRKNNLYKQSKDNSNNKSCSDKVNSKFFLQNRKFFNSLDDDKSKKKTKILDSKLSNRKIQKKVQSKNKIKQPKQKGKSQSNQPSPKNKYEQSQNSKKFFKAKTQIKNMKKNIKQFNDYQNQYVDRKITEVSNEELQYSILKSKILFKNKEKSFKILPQTKFQIKPVFILKKFKPKNRAIQSLKRKIIQKVQKDYRGLSQKQSKLLIAIILIQRLWRQKKVKNLIDNFLHPQKPAINHEQNKPKYNIYQKMVNKIIQQKPLLNVGQNFKSPQKKYDKKNNNIIESFKVVSSNNKKKLKSNSFSLLTSISQKCLIQKKLFTFQSINQSLQLCQKKIKQKLTIKKTIENKKSNIVKIVTFQNQLKHQDQWIQQVQPLQKQEYSKIDDSLSLEQIPINIIQKDKIVQKGNSIVNDTVNSLIEQFISQFIPFSKKTKSSLKQKKRLPGLKINQQTITNYLDGFINFIQKNYKQNVVKNLNKIIGVKPETLLKFLRPDTDQDVFIDSQQQIQDQYSKGPVLPNQIYFEYEQIFQRNHLIIKQDEEKYINFIKTILKIHNKSLVDGFVQILDQLRIFGVNGKPYPWQKQFKRLHKQIIIDEFNDKMNTAKNQLLQLTQYGLGNLNTKSHFYQEVQEQNLLCVIKQEYNQQQKQWISYQEQHLLIQLQITNFVFEYILEEVIKDIKI